jgi:hypothetical protein
MSLVKGRFIDKTIPIKSSQDPVDGDDLARKSYVDTAASDAASGKIDSSEIGLTVASLVDGLVPSSQLPSYVDDVLEFANLAALPETGETGKIYVTLDTSKTYRWSGSTYVEISAGPASTDDLAEGTLNLYFSDSLAKSAAVADEIDPLVVDVAPSQKAVSDALDLKQDSLGTGTTSQFLRGDLTWQEVSGGGGSQELYYYDDVASLPAVGNVDYLYGTKDENRLWRWGSVGIPLVPDWVVGATGDFATLQDALADSNVVNGQVIEIQAGTYSVASNITISKELKIFGAGIGETILQTAGTSGDPVTMITVNANNVMLKGMTLKHRKSTNSSVESVVTVSAGSFPTFTYVSGFIMDSCRLEYCEFGVVMRGNGFKLSNNQIAYATGTVSNSNRAIGVYGSQGNCFIMNNLFDNVSINNTAYRAIYSTSTNNTSNELCSGKLIIAGNSHVGLLQQFYLQDNVRGSAGDYDLYFNNNVTNETSLFAGIFLSTANQADLFGEIVASGNSISNNHETATGFGKGLFAIDGSGTSLSYRSAALPVHSVDNVLAQTTLRSDFTEATGSSGSIVAYKNTVFTPVTVSMDDVIPAEPEAPATPGEASAGYEEMSPALVENQIASGEVAKAPSQDAVYNALALKQDSLGTGTTSQYLRGDLTWQEVSGGSSITFKKEVFTLSAGDITNAYVDCAYLAAPESMLLMSGGVVHQESESYTLSEVGGVTRITFIGDLVVPSDSALEEGDKVYVQYHYVNS